MLDSDGFVKTGWVHDLLLTKDVEKFAVKAKVTF